MTDTAMNAKQVPMGNQNGQTHAEQKRRPIRQLILVKEYHPKARKDVVNS